MSTVVLGIMSRDTLEGKSRYMRDSGDGLTTIIMIMYQLWCTVISFWQLCVQNDISHKCHIQRSQSAIWMGQCDFSITRTIIIMCKS